jgi:hypothetical protein
MTKKETEKLWTIITKLNNFQHAIKDDYVKEEIQKAKDILTAVELNRNIQVKSG